MPSIEDLLVIGDNYRSRFEHDGIAYSGRLYDLYFSGSQLLSKVYFSRGRVHKKPDYIFRTNQKVPLIINGEIQNSRFSGYRAAIVGGVANKGYVLSDEVLNNVFTNLESRILSKYEKVFPTQNSDQDFEGVIVEIIEPGDNSDAFKYRSPSVLYVVQNLNGSIFRLGIKTEHHIELKHPLMLGEHIKGTFNSSENLAYEKPTQTVEIGTSFLLTTQATSWYPIISYNRVDSLQISKPI